jgi:ubiquinone/menaquinone biosynthesis C-methylase UbiE
VDTRIKQEGLKNIKTVWSNLELIGATNIPTGSLDIAFIHNVLFQAGKHDSFLKETARLLKAGGKLMVIDWKKIASPFGPPVKDRPEPELIKNMAAKAGLKLLEEFEAGPYHFGLIFTR